jgi:hypothetical protein
VHKSSNVFVAEGSRVGEWPAVANKSQKQRELLVVLKSGSRLVEESPEASPLSSEKESSAEEPAHKRARSAQATFPSSLPLSSHKRNVRRQLIPLSSTVDDDSGEGSDVEILVTIPFTLRKLSNICFAKRTTAHTHRHMMALHQPMKRGRVETLRVSTKTGMLKPKATKTPVRMTDQAYCRNQSGRDRQ